MGYPRLLKPKWLVFIPLLAILAVVAVACGGDEDTPTAAAPTSTSAAPEPTAMMESTMAPEPTAMMEPTEAPEPTAMMEATMAPEPTAMMEATTAPEPTAMMMATPIAIATPTTIPEVAGIQPKYGGIMPAEAAAGSPSTWDPHTAVYLEDIQVQSGMYNQLLEFNPLNDDPYTEGDILGEIARAWEVADDGLSYTFYLREDVTWSDGERLDADDVVWSLNRMIEPGAVRPQTGKLRQYIQLGSVEKVDDFTVTLKITYPSAAFIPFVAVDYMKILPTHILEGREDDIDLRQFESHDGRLRPLPGDGQPARCKLQVQEERELLEDWPGRAGVALHGRLRRLLHNGQGDGDSGLQDGAHTDEHGLDKPPGAWRTTLAWRTTKSS